MRPGLDKSRKEDVMKKVCAFTSVFVIAFLIGIGAVVFTAENVEARRICLKELPCHPDNIYCTSTPCPGTCYPNGGVFYCAPDWNIEYCSGDYYWPVPCSHIL